MRKIAHVTVSGIKVLPNKYRDITRYLFRTALGRELLWYSSYGGRHTDGRALEVGDELTLRFTVRGDKPDGTTEITRAKAVDPLPLPVLRVDPRQLEMWA